MEEDGGGGTKMATEGPQVMRRRKYDLMPQAYKDELVRASQEDATAWDDARFKAAWQKLTAAEQKNLIVDAASAAKAAAGKPNAKRRRELGGQGPSKSANTGASSGKSVIGEGASPSPLEDSGGQMKVTTTTTRFSWRRSRWRSSSTPAGRDTPARAEAGRMRSTQNPL